MNPWKDKREIGNATLYLGDCLEILPHLPRVDAVITDPPYNVGKIYGLHNDSMTDETYAEWCAARVNAARAVASNQFWIAPRYKMALWLRLLPEAHLIVVRRGAAGPFRAGWMDQFETALAIGRPAQPAPDLWDDIRLKGEGYFFREETYDHPGYTPYPIMERAIHLFTEHSICDPFMGTGTSGEAAVKVGRAYIGIEIEPKYFDIACERIENAQRQGRMFREDIQETMKQAQININL